MKKSSIIAHRGLWSHEIKANSKQALTSALEMGFGLETDVRDYSGELIISHDPPATSSSVTPLRWLTDAYAMFKSNSRIALNIKSDGLNKMLTQCIYSLSLSHENIFAFDMSIPDMIRYINGPISIYSRVSEFEEQILFEEKVHGVWVDNFQGSFDQLKYAQKALGMGLRATIVSPELHSRDHRPLWHDILNSKIYKHPCFEICTDFPVQASEQFCN